MPSRVCAVSFTDDRGTIHRVEVRAGSLNEAVGLAVEQFRSQNWVPPVGPSTRLRVQVRPPSVEHDVTVASVQRWTEAAATSPADRLQRQRVRAMLLGQGSG